MRKRILSVIITIILLILSSATAFAEDVGEYDANPVKNEQEQPEIHKKVEEQYQAIEGETVRDSEEDTISEKAQNLEAELLEGNVAYNKTQEEITAVDIEEKAENIDEEDKNIADEESFEEQDNIKEEKSEYEEGRLEAGKITAEPQTPLPVNNIKAVSLNQGKIQVSWDASVGAEGYLVYRKTGNERNMTYCRMTSMTSIVDTTAVANTYTYYRIYPYVKNTSGVMKVGSSSGYVYSRAYDGPEPVNNLMAQLLNNSDVKLNWSSIEKADGYLIYRKSENDDSFKYLYMVSQTTFIDKTASKDVFNFYRVYPYFNDINGRITGTSNSYVYAKPISAPLPVTGLKASLSYSSQVQLEWTASKNAEGYIIYRKVGSDEKFTYRYMVPGNTFIDTTAQAGEYNFYRVYPYFTDSSGKRHTGQSTAYVFAKPIYFPLITSLATNNNQWDGTLNITWNMDGYWASEHEIVGYLVYRRIGNSGAFKYLATVDNSSYYWNGYEDKTASYIENNFYKVYPYYERENGVKQIGPCNVFTYGKAKIPGAYELYAYEQIDQVRLQWSVNSYVKADGYDVYRKQGDGNFTYLGTTKSLEYIDKGASKTMMNYYRVYPYRTINGKHILGNSNSYVYGRAKHHSKGQSIADYGWQFIGTPYVWGGNDLSSGVDCSGFTTQVYAHFNIQIPRTSYTQEYAGKDLGRDLSNAKPGDVICYCYNLSEPSCHVAIYVGNGRMIHSSTSYDINGREISGIQIGNANYMTIKTIRRFW